VGALLLLIVAGVAGQAFRACDALDGRVIFAQRCAQCHSLDQPLSLLKEPAAWRATVERMAAKQPAAFRPAEIKAIEDHLTACCTPPVAVLFERRCGICHDTTKLLAQSLSPFEWAYLTDACRARLPARIGLDEARRLVVWLHGGRKSYRRPDCVTCHWRARAAKLTERDALPWLALGPETDAEHFLLTCGLCHTSGTLAEPHPDAEWPAILDRMQAKQPAWVTDDQLPAVQRHIQLRAAQGRGPWPVDQTSAKTPLRRAAVPRADK
jgi:mono/diheme cytochrome c family protein